MIEYFHIFLLTANCFIILFVFKGPSCLVLWFYLKAASADLTNRESTCKRNALSVSNSQFMLFTFFSSVLKTTMIFFYIKIFYFLFLFLSLMGWFNNINILWYGLNCTCQTFFFLVLSNQTLNTWLYPNLVSNLVLLSVRESLQAQSLRHGCGPRDLWVAKVRFLPPLKICYLYDLILRISAPFLFDLPFSRRKKVTQTWPTFFKLEQL